MDYGRHHLEPDRGTRYGPWRRAERMALVTTSKALRAAKERTVAWWSVRGRGGLLVAAFGVIVALGGLFAANGDRGLVRTLSERGIGASAVVTGVSHGRTGSLMDDVRFTVHDRELTEALSSFNNVPDTLKK